MVRSAFALVESADYTTLTPSSGFGLSHDILGARQVDLSQIYWRPVEVPAVQWYRQTVGVANVQLFFHNTVITTSTSVSVISATAQSVDYRVVEPMTGFTHSIKLRNLEVPQVRIGSNSWTVTSWEIATMLPDTINAAIGKIDTLIGDIGRAKPIRRSDRLMGLADTAATASPPDERALESWVRQLVDDVKSAND